MIEPRPLKSGDRVAIVSLSGGTLGESFCIHSLEIGVRRIREFGLEPVFMPNALKGVGWVKAHPEARAADLKAAFSDDSIAAVLCAIGGDDTYRTLPYLMDDAEFTAAVREHPKLFTGFSDTTINHLMFHRLGMQSFYGPCFLCDFAELADDMLPYTRKTIGNYFRGYREWKITPGDTWYEERTDFSAAAVGTDRTAHREERGYELLQGAPVFCGELLGGCLESIYDILVSDRYADEGKICARYGLFPEKDEWRGKLLFIETCEEQPSPELFRKELGALKSRGVFEAVSGILVGKPQNERYYDEYKRILPEAVGNPDVPILYNLNFGHAYPRTALPYGAKARVDAVRQVIDFE